MLFDFDTSPAKAFKLWLSEPDIPGNLYRVEVFNGDPTYLIGVTIPILRETPQMWWVDHWSCPPGKLKGILKVMASALRTNKSYGRCIHSESAMNTIKRD